MVFSLSDRRYAMDSINGMAKLSPGVAVRCQRPGSGLCAFINDVRSPDYCVCTAQYSRRVATVRTMNMQMYSTAVLQLYASEAEGAYTLC